MNLYNYRKSLENKGYPYISVCRQTLRTRERIGFKMRQFYETYRDEEGVAPLVRQLYWTHNLLIQGGCKRPEKCEFHLRLSLRERWGKRELERQENGVLFERALLSSTKVSAVLRQLHRAAETIFKDTYLLDLLDLHEARELLR